MNRNLIPVAIAAILFIAGCQQQQPTVNIADEITAAQAVLAQYVESIETENMDLYSSVMSHDSTMVNFGAMGEPIIGWEALKKVIEAQNVALSDTDIETEDVRMHMAPTGDHAWATSLWTLHAKMDDKPVEMHIRCTWVLEKMDAGWKIVHFHKSVAAG